MPAAAQAASEPEEPVLDDALDWDLLAASAAALEHGTRVTLERPIRNVHRCVGGILSSHIAQRHGEKGLADGTIHVEFSGSAGQSFGGWLAPGVSFRLHGDANDYTGKGLSGGTLAVLLASMSASVGQLVVAPQAVYFSLPPGAS